MIYLNVMYRKQRNISSPTLLISTLRYTIEDASHTDVDFVPGKFILHYGISGN